MTQTNKITGILKHNSSANPKAPKLKGFVQINGQQYWISAWWNPNGNGKVGAKLEHEPHYQLVFEPAEDRPQSHVGGTPYPQKAYMGIPANAGAHPSTQPRSLVDMDDDIPF